MKNTDEIQGVPGSGLLARPLHFKKRGEWFYYPRMSSKSQRQGSGAAAQKSERPRRPARARRRGTRVDSPLPVDASPQHSERTQEGFQAQSRPFRISISVHCAISVASDEQEGGSTSRN